ncbi:hypothetical protein HGA34_00005, partial [Candidatus Falkowbacteria bacterium]|nr:hypothetical protein [Candidatus Falkowbacteria bacterium]
MKNHKNRFNVGLVLMALVLGQFAVVLPKTTYAVVAAPTATAMSFANRVGTVTGNTIDLNLTGVSDADLASAGSIT